MNKYRLPKWYTFVLYPNKIVSIEKVKKLLYSLGVKDIIEKENYLITNTICHNKIDGSMKLYYYKDTHLFYCYTNCQCMSIFKLLENVYSARGQEYDWYEDI